MFTLSWGKDKTTAYIDYVVEGSKNLKIDLEFSHKGELLDYTGVRKLPEEVISYLKDLDYDMSLTRGQK